MSGEELLPVFGVCPNDASTPMMERLWFGTDIITAYNGTEQLRGTRTTPRRMFEYEMALSDDVRRFMASRVFANGAGRWQLPVWADGVALGSLLASGSTSVPITTTGREFVPGFAVIVGKDARETELLTVSAVAGGSLTVAATSKAWPAGSMVYPAIVARMDGPWTVQAFTDASVYGVARFMAVQANPSAEVAPATTYRGLPVFDFCPQSSEPEYTFDRIVAITDDDIGVPFQSDAAGMPFPVQSMMVVAETPAEVARLRGLIYWLDGMRNVLWVPTFLQDLNVTSVAGAAITVTACNYTADINKAMNRRDIRVVTKAGAIYHRRITACTDGGATETLTLDSALGVSAADIKLVSFMAAARSDSDNFELIHMQAGDVGCAMTFRALRHDV